MRCGCRDGACIGRLKLLSVEASADETLPIELGCACVVHSFTVTPTAAACVFALGDQSMALSDAVPDGVRSRRFDVRCHWPAFARITGGRVDLVYCEPKGACDG
jgi:hypothetical protein